ncbi:MAG: hypothetical protein J5826_07535 [Bacteroidales bacterium]|nr:hypothetical protein [Bacteroidales bacterium]
MKTITALLTAILIAVATSLSAQSDPIFWFNVKVFNKVDKHSRQKQYDVRPFSTKISNGSIKAFSKALWKCTATGHSIAIGPFKSYTQAEAALKLYKMVNDTITPRATNQNRAWFLVKVNITERAHAYQFERMAARVAEGSEKEFSDVLRESLAFKTLAIGPFAENVDAEEAKSLYRLEE